MENSSKNKLQARGAQKGVHMRSDDRSKQRGPNWVTLSLKILIHIHPPDIHLNGKNHTSFKARSSPHIACQTVFSSPNNYSKSANLLKWSLFLEILQFFLACPQNSRAAQKGLDSPCLYLTLTSYIILLFSPRIVWPVCLVSLSLEGIGLTSSTFDSHVPHNLTFACRIQGLLCLASLGLEGIGFTLCTFDFHAPRNLTLPPELQGRFASIHLAWIRTEPKWGDRQSICE